MKITRLLGALIAGAAGAVAGGAATVVASYLYGTVAFFTVGPSRPASRGIVVFVSVFVAVFIPVMAAVFQALERMGLVREPPTSQSPLGLSAASPESSNARGADREHEHRH